MGSPKGEGEDINVYQDDYAGGDDGYDEYGAEHQAENDDDSSPEDDYASPEDPDSFSSVGDDNTSPDYSNYSPDMNIDEASE